MLQRVQLNQQDRSLQTAVNYLDMMIIQRYTKLCYYDMWLRLMCGWLIVMRSCTIDAFDLVHGDMISAVERRRLFHRREIRWALYTIQYDLSHIQ